MVLGAIDATLRMEQQVKDGMPLRDAHHAVAEEVARNAIDGGGTRDDGKSMTNVDASAYKTIGGASPEETRRAADALLVALEQRGT